MIKKKVQLENFKRRVYLIQIEISKCSIPLEIGERSIDINRFIRGALELKRRLFYH